MREFICDYSKISPAVLEKKITLEVHGAWGAWSDIDEDKFEFRILEPFKSVKVDWDKVAEIINPYLYRG